MEPLQLFESVPNFSEGIRAEVIAEIAGAAAHAHVLDVDADADHNRVVVSLAGQGPSLVDALVASVQVATEHIDLRQHRGVHPRVGVADVLPIVPLGTASIDAARELASEASGSGTSCVYLSTSTATAKSTRLRTFAQGGRSRPLVAPTCTSPEGPP